MSYFGLEHKSQHEESPNVFRRQSYDDDAQLGDIDAGLGADGEDAENKTMSEDGARSPRDPVAEELVGRSLASELEAA